MPSVSCSPYLSFSTLPEPFIFAEPDCDRVSGSFFYEPKDLKTHGYSSQDQTAVEALMSKVRVFEGDRKIGWLLKDVIGICQEQPLIKSKQAVLEGISAAELSNRVEKILYNNEMKFKKGEYWITEPRGNGGIYIWDGEV